ENELLRIQTEAAAARQEANAQRLEARAERLEAQAKQVESWLRRSDLVHAAAAPKRSPASSAGTVQVQPAAIDQPAGPTPRFEDYAAIRQAWGQQPSLKRIDGPHGLRGPKEPAAPPKEPAAPPGALPTLHEPSAGQSSEPSSESVSGPLDSPAPGTVDDTIQLDHTIKLDQAIELEEAPEDEGSSNRRRKGPWLISAIVHAIVILGLGLVVFEAETSGDQLALTATSSTEESVTLESVVIENSEPTETSPSSEMTPEFTEELAIAPAGETLPPAVLGETITENPLTRSMQSTSAALRSISDSTAKASTEFCGVSGGGNHFVYLVDSSGSMGDGFNSARTELLRAIEQLTPKQRFFVVFFDAESDYMRVSNPATADTVAVHATPENKASLRRWAMTIQKDRGQHPADELEFALGLRPDVIFLLSDGEFPERIETLLREKNRVENLFGDSDPISIVHTIGYHSREGEERMRRIARDNGGQYRHVPKPR
ncbi:MAG: hypothetical protein AAF958_15520, partial [Planctomycetota bacterium]